MAAVRQAVQTGVFNISGEDLEAWVIWARAHADELDPIESKTALQTKMSDDDRR